MPDDYDEKEVNYVKNCVCYDFVHKVKVLMCETKDCYWYGKKKKARHLDEEENE
jgi:hypothetical protein